MMLELEAQGALNINLVTALHYAPDVRQAVLDARAAGLTLPIVCNTSGYENPEVVRAMADVVDVWLPDFKYADPALAGSLSAAPDYPDVAAAALGAMVADLREKGGRKEGPDGPALSGASSCATWCFPATRTTPAACWTASGRSAATTPTSRS